MISNVDITDALSSTLNRVKALKDPETHEELVQQTALVQEAIERCEKMMQSLAMSMSNSGELSAMLSNYNQLLKRQEHLEARRSQLDAALDSQPLTDPRKRTWWRFWIGKK